MKYPLHLIKNKSATLLRNLVKSMFPSCRTEWILFAVSAVCYSFMGISLIINNDILWKADPVPGTYLGYDNIAHSTNSGGAWDISHPFFVFFHFIRFLAGTLLNRLFGPQSSIIFCVLLMSFLISSGLVVLYKYLRSTTLLSAFRSMLLAFFCGSFFTVMVLSFTTETYPFSFLFLILSIFILSDEYMKKKRFSTSTVSFTAFLCGGITITNWLKPASMLFLNKDSFKSKCIRLAAASVPFIICTAGLYLLYFIKSHTIDAGTDYSAQHLSQTILGYLHAGGNYFKEVFIDYWSSALLAPPLTYQTVYTETVLRPSIYTSWYQYVVPAALLVMTAASLWLNRKKTLVKMLMCYALVDIIIHLIFRYGMNEAVIFGGHWLFLIPMALGWLYDYFKNSKKISILLDACLCFFTLLLLYNNLSEILRSFFV